MTQIEPKELRHWHTRITGSSNDQLQEDGAKGPKGPVLTSDPDTWHLPLECQSVASPAIGLLGPFLHMRELHATQIWWAFCSIPLLLWERGG